MTMARASSKSDPASLRLHVVLWYIVVALMMVLIAETVALLNAVFGPGETTPGTLMVYGLLWAALVAVLVYWGSRLFFPKNLQRLLQAKGAADYVVKQRWVRARVDHLWLMVHLDHPLLDYAPLRNRWYRASARAGPHASIPPHYMLEIGWANVFRLGDFRGLPQVTIKVSQDSDPRDLAAQVRVPALVGALRDAAVAIKEPDTVLGVEIAEQWLRVEVNGGSWLGSRFGNRILEALDFAERMARKLSSDIEPLDTDDWTVYFEDKRFGVARRGQDPMARMTRRMQPQGERDRRRPAGVVSVRAIRAGVVARLSSL